MNLQQWLSVERGRAKALADHLHIPASMVSKMGSGEKQIPVDHCPFIEVFTEGAVTCEEQRPDKVEYFTILRSRAKGIEEPVTQPGAL
jgi:DNA-binding transcriptional regulator YdaS (Cro superfamily)